MRYKRHYRSRSHIVERICLPNAHVGIGSLMNVYPSVESTQALSPTVRELLLFAWCSSPNNDNQSANYHCQYTYHHD